MCWEVEDSHEWLWLFPVNQAAESSAEGQAWTTHVTVVVQGNAGLGLRF